MNRERNLFLCLALGVQVALCGGCPVSLDGGSSDVPCVDPNWPTEVCYLYLRPDGEGGFLMTVQTCEHGREDDADGLTDYIPHARVYRFDPLRHAFVSVDDTEWDTSTAAVQECCPSLIEEGPLRIIDDRLVFEGRAVPVVGGTALDMDDAPTLPVAAVLSTNGYRGGFGTATGQHYHQLFSLETGRAIGPALRLGIGGANLGRTFIGWTDDEGYVLYHASSTQKDIARLCVVSVREILESSRRQEQ